MKRTLLLDADIIAFKFASVTENVYDFGDTGVCVSSDFERAKAETEAYVADLTRDLSATDVIVCLSDPLGRYFRHDVWSNYKGNRKGLRKPTDLMNLKAWFKERFQTYERPGLEADDCMGILATHPTLVKGERIMVSEDKDMQTIPATLFNPNKDGAPRKIGRLAADRFFLWQAIVGDQTDGYPGAYRVGPASEEAQAVLVSKTIEEAWGHVLAAHRRSPKRTEGNTPEQEALVMARLSRILRASDWQFREKRPVLWLPPS